MEDQNNSQNNIESNSPNSFSTIPSKEKFEFGKFHDKYYKKLFLIPIILLLFSLVYMGMFYSQNGDFIYKDVSLTGGTAVTVYE